jgi:hypothetical protein
MAAGQIPKPAVNAATAQCEPGEAGPCCHFSTSGAGSKQQFMRREVYLAQCRHDDLQDVVGTCCPNLPEAGQAMRRRGT